MFEPIDKTVYSQPDRYYEKIIESIKVMMINGDLVAGGKLPSERELAQIFEVSRVPVREALKVLEFIGVVRRVHGEGMYIQNIDFSDIIDKLEFAIETTGDTIEELFELRESLETTAAGLAAKRRTDKDIARMQQSIDKMEFNILKGEDVYEASSEFHDAIIKATKNKVIYKVYESLYEFLQLSRGVTLSRNDKLDVSLEFHKKIFNKIVAQDEEGAMAIMREHMIEAKQHVYEDK